MAKQPAFQFYPGDWLKDPALRLCTPAARGAWIDMLCLMFESEDRGHLITNGQAWTIADIARAIGCQPKSVRELIAKGVARESEAGVIFSPRMVRDAKVAKARSEAGSKGGSPILLKQNGSKHEAGPEQSAKQRPTPSSSSSSSSSDK
ncbi:MAG: hypothetical protein AAGA55_03125, partial [Planctomycetota bacterium]